MKAGPMFAEEKKAEPLCDEVKQLGSSSDGATEDQVPTLSAGCAGEN
jgi:hypothetical protein